jgi:hypothetical protein
MTFRDRISRGVARLATVGTGVNFPVFYHKDHLAYFPDLDIVFNRVKKSGNTSICAFLAGLSGNPRAASAQQLKKSLISPLDLPSGQLRGIVNDRYSFAAVRDPYARVLSAYLHRVDAGNPTPRDPLFSNGEYLGKPGFEKFLHELSDGKILMNRHYWPQTDLLFKPAHKFARIIKLETLAEGMSLVLRDNGLPEERALILQAPHELERSQAGKVTGASDRLARFYSDKSLRIVNELYSSDFATFSYPVRAK